jgi:phosphate-selective porin
MQAEYIRLTDERRGQSVEDTDLPPLVADGWYLGATYALTGERNRRSGVELAARYETLGFGSRGADAHASTSARADAVLGNTDRAMTLGISWSMNRWVRLQANVVREDIQRPSMGPVPARPGFWSRAFRIQLTI